MGTSLLQCMIYRITNRSSSILTSALKGQSNQGYFYRGLKVGQAEIKRRKVIQE